MSRSDIITKLIDMGYWVRLSGSRVTDHYTDHSDWDYVVYDKDGKVASVLENYGFTFGGSERPEAQFQSFRSGDTNIIVCSDKDYYNKYVLATEVMRAANPKTKEERIKIFDTIFGKTNNDQHTECPF